MTPTTVAAALCDATRRLREAGVDSPRRDARLLLGLSLGVEHAALLDPSRTLPGRERRVFEDRVERREAREPVSRITGRREFWGLEFEVTPDVLDPRPDSEAVVETALGAFRGRPPPARVLDLGTGSGCLLCALLSEFDGAEGVGVDRSPAAAATAGANARRLGLGGRARVVAGDWCTALAGPFDLIVANPPYVAAGDLERLQPEVARYDPELALNGGDDGLAAYRELVPQLANVVRPGAVCAFEVGLGKAPAVRAWLRETGFGLIAVQHDLAGFERCVVAVWPT